MRRSVVGRAGVVLARHLGEVLRVRTLARLGIDVRVGIGPSIAVAATVYGQIPTPGGVLSISPDEVAEWLGVNGAYWAGGVLAGEIM
ncbi:hypothetical protein NFX46_19645 [Streptomyces phaeoluteigriseus]|uniref:UmuC domain-containing protein n=1 Tax=Streptomyces phaeoluteigriseus TaxID=114686 RepID=A0ABY4ZLG0_9ACTN|nr:hypothetical protein [Streptomyces phaeoluteigriseus]USQ89857.1 hypothetical protein NFX46_19645 [Streptomyces phaeoluteigriseus]